MKRVDFDTIVDHLGLTHIIRSKAESATTRIKRLLEKKYWLLVQTQSQTKATGITLPEVHGAKEMLDTKVLPEKQKSQIQTEQVGKNRPKLGRGRTGIRCK